LQSTRRYHNFDYPFPSAKVVELFRQYYGPTNRTFSTLDDLAVKKLREELETLWSTHNRAGDELSLPPNISRLGRCVRRLEVIAYDFRTLTRCRH
jgi:hypothetical protein